MLARLLKIQRPFASPSFLRPGWLRASGLASGLCLTLAAGVSPLRPGLVSGRSMEPTLQNHSFFVYDRGYYRDHPLRAGEVVVFRHAGGIWIKRIFAVGGESFWSWRRAVGRGALRHDPILTEQRYRFARVAAHRRALYGEDGRIVRLQVPPGTVFVVGDCPWSVDSRQIGPVDVQDVLGRVVPLPGQQLGTVAESVELSFPTPVRVAARPLSDDRSVRPEFPALPPS